MNFFPALLYGSDIPQLIHDWSHEVLSPPPRMLGREQSHANFYRGYKDDP